MRFNSISLFPTKLSLFLLFCKIMRLPTLLSLLFLVAFSTVKCNYRSRQVPSGWAKTVLENHIHALGGAIRSQNRELLGKLFRADETNTIEILLSKYKTAKFSVQNAQYVGSDYKEIQGSVRVKPEGKIVVTLAHNGRAQLDGSSKKLENADHF
ncbi:DUF4440 domain-containing protein [Caenorhabditis elegans]|uniref:DUF4440 domain-containing protein n=1 Tax=Caenorhabditis elegans TaxID=6239 RepID=O44801_CAEEL|nr:DUF4440 domain-containing protein [Caenorhabditis elegans]CCD69496.1 DUF4440 domain-containing protein [Caenorhabditis elegans]|eukprot:NP_494509.2 Uncharacterized protein CELE_F14D2.7 [Caenorhabditis elegans]